MIGTSNQHREPADMSIAYWRHPMWLIVLVTLTVAPTSIHAQDETERGFAILSHKIHLHLFPRSQSIIVTDTILLRLTTTHRRSVSFDFPPFYEVEEFIVAGAKAEFGKTTRLLEFIPRSSSSVFVRTTMKVCSEDARADTNSHCCLPLPFRFPGLSIL